MCLCLLLLLAACAEDTPEFGRRTDEVNQQAPDLLNGAQDVPLPGSEDFTPSGARPALVSPADPAQIARQAKYFGLLAARDEQRPLDDEGNPVPRPDDAELKLATVGE